MNLFLNILQFLCILFVVCLFVLIVVSVIENQRLTVTHYEIMDDRIPEAFHGYHIVQLTDLHNAEFGKANVRLLTKVKELHPDVIFVTGDVIVGKPGANTEIGVSFLNALCNIAPVYFSMGNHELRAQIYTDTYGDLWERFQTGLSEEVHVLQDAHTILFQGDSCIHLYGLGLTPEYYRRLFRTPMKEEYLRGVFGTCQEGSYHIFLAHNPEYFKEYVAWGANLIFAGHVHGGMIRLPLLGGVISPMLHLFPHYDKGLFKNNNQYMILSSGLGNHTFKIRFCNLPEIVSVTLSHKAG